MSQPKLRFKNQTDLVVYKAKNRGKRREKKSNVLAKHIGSLSKEAALRVSPQPQQSYGFSAPTATTALSYFMISYITSSRFEAYLPHLFINTTSFPKDPLLTAIDAASLAAFALYTRDQSQRKCIQRLYSKALEEIRIALEDKKTAVHDRTLAAILVLALLESLMLQEKKALKNWTMHTLGTLEVLRLRGKEQFESPVSRELFAHASFNIHSSCILRAMKVPSHLVELAGLAVESADPSDLNLKLNIVASKINDLRTRCQSFEDTGLMMTEALIIDQEVARIMSDPNNNLDYISRPAESNLSWAYNGTVHNYKSQNLAKYANAFGMFRIMACEVVACGATVNLAIIEQKPNPLPSETIMVAKMQSYARTQIARLETALLCSVPSFLDKSNNNPGERLRFSYSARSLFWPLGNLQGGLLCSDAARECAYAFIDRIGDDLQMPQIAQMAKAPCYEAKNGWCVFLVTLYGHC